MPELLLSAGLLVLLFVLLAAGVWVAFALIIVGGVAMAIFSPRPDRSVVFATTIWGASNSWALAALPLFILMGEILLRSDLSRDLFKGLAPGSIAGRAACSTSTSWAAPSLPPSADRRQPPQPQSAKCRSLN